jgi:hypothetical protein
VTCSGSKFRGQRPGVFLEEEETRALHGWTYWFGLWWIRLRHETQAALLCSFLLKDQAPYHDALRRNLQAVCATAGWKNMISNY